MLRRAIRFKAMRMRGRRLARSCRLVFVRSAGSVLKRGIEVLAGPTLHLQHIRRGDAARIEIDLAGALADAGIRVEGGH